MKSAPTATAVTAGNMLTRAGVDAVAPGPSYLMVDLSYAVFHTYYATLKFYKNTFDPDPDIDSIMESPLFVSRLCRGFTRRVMLAAQAAGEAPHVILAEDCERDSVWRRDILPEYKSTRSRKVAFNAAAFDAVFERSLPGLVRDTGAIVLSVPRAEADDVIGVLHAHLRAAEPAARFVILTNDNDYIQLADEATRVLNMAMEDVALRRPPGVAPSDYLRCRVICGDKSDNVTGALPRCGMRTAVAMVHEEGHIERMLMENDSFKLKYEINQKVMNFDLIPCEIRRNIIAAFETARRTCRATPPPPPPPRDGRSVPPGK